jgi:hypothetical protein
MEHLSVVEMNNADRRLELAEQIVEQCVVFFATDFFRCAVVCRAVNLLRNGNHPDAVRAEMRKVNGFADYGYDEP